MQFDSFEWRPLFSSKVMFKVSVNYRKNSFSLIIRRLCILCLKRFKQQILNFCDKLWQGGVVMWCSPRFWGECFSVAFKKQSRDCVNFVSYRSRTLLLVHNNSVIFKYTLHRWGYCFKNYLLVLHPCSQRISNKLPFSESCDWILYFLQLCRLTVLEEKPRE